MESLKKRYDELYQDMASSKDVDKMKVFGRADRWAFCKIAEQQPKLARTWLDKIEAGNWNNFLSEEEAMNITSAFINQNGSRGPKWSMDAFSRAVESCDGHLEHKPEYNEYALWVTACMIYSDHANSIAEDMGYKSASEVPAEKMIQSCYRKAVEKLKDPDRPRFVREYFEDNLE